METKKRFKIERLEERIAPSAACLIKFKCKGGSSFRGGSSCRKKGGSSGRKKGGSSGRKGGSGRKIRCLPRPCVLPKNGPC